MHVLVPLMVLLPLLGAAFALAAGRARRLQIATSITTLSVTTAVAALIMYFVDRDGPVVIEVGAWPAPQGIVLSVDRLGAIMLVVSYLMLLGVLIIYLIMVAQFQSLLSPFIVILTVPLSFAGGFLGLLAAGFHMSIVSMVGMIMLVEIGRAHV